MISAREQLRLLVELVVQPIRSATADGWLDFWVEHISEYTDRVRAIYQLLDLIGAPHRRNEDPWSDILAAFPDCEDEISYFEFAYTRATDRVRKFHANPIADPERQKADSDAARTFNDFAPIFGLCITTLNIIAAPRSYRLDTDELEVADGVLNAVWVTARHSLESMRAAVMVAERLRGIAEDDADSAITDPIVLDEKSFTAFTARIENPREPNAVLRALFKK